MQNSTLLQQRLPEKALEEGTQETVRCRHREKLIKLTRVKDSTVLKAFQYYFINKGQVVQSMLM